MGDDAWLEALVRDGALSGRVQDIIPISEGAVFVTARGRHVSTRRKVLLTISRPGDLDALTQLRTLRELLTLVGDERVGIVLDAFWPQSPQRQPVWGCLVSTFHDGLSSFESSLTILSPSSSQILGWMRSVTRQLQKIHMEGFAHGDISMSNILVDRDRQIHLVDFEHAVNSKTLSRSRVGVTEGFTHPDKVSVASTGRASIVDFQTWDRYSLGQVFLSLLSNLTPLLVSGLTPKTQRAIRLLGCLLLDGRNTAGELALGLPAEFFKDEAFSSLDQVVYTIDQISGRWTLEEAVPELRGVSSVVEVGLATPVAFSDRVAALLATPHMRSLGQISQLGLIRHIWPTATHTRLEHALGVLGLTASAVVGLATDTESPLFGTVVGVQRIRELLLAALLHDVGHYPLAHDLEEARPELFDHEPRSVRLIMSDPIRSIIRTPEEAGGWSANADNVASIIAGHPVGTSTLGPHICGLLHSVISGPVDADKLDYLVRDSRHLNVKAGQGLDVDRIQRSLTVVVIDGRPSLGVRSKGRRPAELVGRIRSHMFGVAYWHHAYRSIKAMIHWITWLALDLREPGVSEKQLVGRLHASYDADIDSRFGVNALDSGIFLAMTQAVQTLGSVPAMEASVLTWLAAEGDAVSDELFSLLREQRWYQAILTIPHPDNDDVSLQGLEVSDARVLWDLLHRIYKLRGEEYWRARLAVSRSFQGHLVSWLSDRTEGNAKTYVVDFKAGKSGLREHARVSQLFLVDGPDLARANQTELYWSLGDRRGAVTVDAGQAIPIARSYDDKNLVSSFVATNGALRIFCHPAHTSFIERGVSQQTLARLLEESMSEALSSLGRGRPRARKS